MTITLDPTLVAFVKQEEGFSAVAFWDFQQWTNGWGTKAHFAHERIDQVTADQRLEVELEAAQAAVVHFQPDMPAGVLNALTDLTYNEGSGWQHQALGSFVKTKHWVGARDHLLLYDEAGGKVEEGLETRRKREAAWFPQEQAA